MLFIKWVFGRGGKISLFFGIQQRTKKINAIRLMHSFFSSYPRINTVFSRLIIYKHSIFSSYHL